MSNLGPQQQNVSYDGLLQVDGGISSTLKPVQDGMGNMAGLWLSSTGASVTTSDTFIASVDGTQIPNSVSRLISDGFGDYVSVKDFGAIGDGIADDTVALQNALNACKQVIVPSGMTLLVSSTITIPIHAKLSFLGGLGNTLASYPSSYIVKKGTMSTAALVLSSCSFVDGGGVICLAGNNGDGVAIEGNNAKLTNFLVHGAGGCGVRIGANVDGGNYNSFQLDHVTTQYCGSHGLYIHDGTSANGANANAGIVTQHFSQFNGGDGIRLGHAFWVTLLNCLTEVNSGYGLYLSGAVNHGYPECRWATITGGDYNEGNSLGTVFDESYFSSFFGLDFYCIPAASTSALPGSGKNIFLGSNAVNAPGAVNTQSGINFTSIPSTTPNDTLLNYYKTGVFVPYVVGTTSTGTAVYNANVGKYTKIGNVVFFQLGVSWTAGTGTGNLQITNLPYASLNSATMNFQAVSIGNYGSLISLPTGYVPTAAIQSAETKVRIYTAPTGSGGQYPLPYSVTGVLGISGMYFTDN